MLQYMHVTSQACKVKRTIHLLWLQYKIVIGGQNYILSHDFLNWAIYLNSMLPQFSAEKKKYRRCILYYNFSKQEKARIVRSYF